MTKEALVRARKPCDAASIRPDGATTGRLDPDLAAAELAAWLGGAPLVLGGAIAWDMMQFIGRLRAQAQPRPAP
jgi:hypothetical protein